MKLLKTICVSKPFLFNHFCCKAPLSLQVHSIYFSFFLIFLVPSMCLDLLDCFLYIGGTVLHARSINWLDVNDFALYTSRIRLCLSPLWYSGFIGVMAVHSCYEGSTVNEIYFVPSSIWCACFVKHYFQLNYPCAHPLHRYTCITMALFRY